MSEYYLCPETDFMVKNDCPQAERGMLATLGVTLAGDPALALLLWSDRRAIKTLETPDGLTEAGAVVKHGRYKGRPIPPDPPRIWELSVAGNAPEASKETGLLAMKVFVTRTERTVWQFDSGVNRSKFWFPYDPRASLTIYPGFAMRKCVKATIPMGTTVAIGPRRMPGYEMAEAPVVQWFIPDTHHRVTPNAPYRAFAPSSWRFQKEARAL